MVESLSKGLTKARAKWDRSFIERSETKQAEPSQPEPRANEPSGAVEGGALRVDREASYRRDSIDRHLLTQIHRSTDMIIFLTLSGFAISSILGAFFVCSSGRVITCSKVGV